MASEVLIAVVVCANSLLSFTFLPQTDNPAAAQLDKVRGTPLGFWGEAACLSCGLHTRLVC